MDDDVLVLAGEFATPTAEQWEAEVGKVLLKGDAQPTVEEIERAIAKRLTTRTYDGVTIRPLYDEGPDPAGLPGTAPFTRGGRSTGQWDVRQRVDVRADGEGAAALVLAELERGSTSVFLGLRDASTIDADLLTRVLAGVHLDIAPVVLDCEERWPQAAEALLAMYEKAGVAPSAVLGADPIGVYASTGGAIAPDLPALAALAGRLVGSESRAVVVESTRYLDAGSADAEEIGCSLATGVAYLRALTDAGLSVADAAAQIEFRIGINADQFTTIAKLRAARKAWTRITEVAGAPAAQRQHAVTARVMLTRYDPWVNLLRGTTACFAAATGGADAITVSAFDSLREPDSTSIGRRLARNTQALLAHESNLTKVADPGGGSWYIESLTEDLAAAAWTWFQEIEAAGGIVQALEAGVVQSRIAATWATRADRLATRRDPLTGLSEFPDIDENLPALEEPLPTRAMTPFAPIVPVRYASGFEALRDQARTLPAATVFLANIGPVSVFTARSTFAKNLFEAGGIRAITNEGFADAQEAAAAFAASGARIACVCSSDAVYAEQAEPVAKALKAAGAERIYLAGQPGDHRDAYVAAGIDEFVFTGGNAQAVLGAALDALEAAR